VVGAVRPPAAQQLKRQLLNLYSGHSLRKLPSGEHKDGFLMLEKHVMPPPKEHRFDVDRQLV
jgi:hypothetical protein